MIAFRVGIQSLGNFGSVRRVAYSRTNVVRGSIAGKRFLYLARTEHARFGHLEIYRWPHSGLP